MSQSGASSDLRLIAWRPDLAHSALRGQRRARRYVAGQLRQCAQGALGLHAAPRAGAPMFTQLLYGEGFRVLEEKAGWAWGQCSQDGYVGYLKADGLARALAPTHRLWARASFVYRQPDIGAPVLLELSLGARLAVRARRKGAGGRAFLHLRRGGYVVAAHAEAWPPPPRASAARRARALQLAQHCLHMPYLWGGRGYGGADCSGLVMQALTGAGLVCPRDSDMQRAAFQPHALRPAAAPRAGDLAFWPGHVGIVAPARRLLHASANAMQVVEEPWAEACARLKARSGADVYLVRPPF